MIEIAFDENSDLSYKNKFYPTLDVLRMEKLDMAQKIDFAQKELLKYKNEPYLIAKTDDFKQIGLAFFIASCLIETGVDCLVFKVKNQKEAMASYKPYIAASIGIKYALRLLNQAPLSVYKELKCLNYLNFSIKESYQDKSIVYTMGDVDKALKIETHTIFDALVEVSVLKALSLADIKKDIVLKVFITGQDEKIVPIKLVAAILEKLNYI